MKLTRNTGRFITVPIDQLCCDVDPFAVEHGFGGKSIDRFPPRSFFGLYLDRPTEAIEAFAEWYRASHIRNGAWMIPKASGGRADGSLARAIWRLHEDKASVIPRRPSELDESHVEEAIQARVRYYFDLFESIREKGFVRSERKPIQCYSRDGSLIIREGHHRVSSLRALGISTVDVRMIKAPARPTWHHDRQSTDGPKSILYITRGNVPSRRAMAVQTCQMAAALAEAGNDVELLTQVAWPELLYRKKNELNELYGLTPTLKVRRLPLTLLPIRDKQGLLRKVPKTYDRLYWRMAMAYSRWRSPDFIYTRYIAFVRHAVESGMPTVLETHKMPLDPVAPVCKEVAAATHMPAFKAFVTISPMIRDAFIELGAAPDKIIICGGGVDLKSFESPSRAALSADADAKMTVGYCGHLYEGRGIETLLASAAQLPDIDFEFVGGYPEHIERWRKIGVPNNVTFHGHLPHREVPERLMAFDVLCMPYSPSCETSPWMSPMKMFEYMAAGKAIVATDLPAIRGLLQHDHNALLCAPDDAGALTDAIKLLDSDPRLRKRLGEQARTDVEQHTWIERATDILQFVDERESRSTVQTFGYTRQVDSSERVASLASQP